MFLTIVGQVITMARKEFDKEAPSYQWNTKAPFVGSGSYNITICSDLGPGYYRDGTLTSTVFSAWALQCLHWLDAKNGWEDSLFKLGYTFPDHEGQGMRQRHLRHVASRQFVRKHWGIPIIVSSK
ncbi:uncharacterized protein LOC143458835 [Clavelina lepadiformis]|uniref:uncharacterized protein LOC143458835 n=1 Tax=Clavelina lepadiformis TaxID=159417 RepID=UPI0040428B8A